MKNFKYFAFLFLIVLFAHCKEEQTVYITINKLDATVELGQTLQLSAEVSGVNFDNTRSKIVWSCDPNQYLSVDENGMVKGLKITEKDNQGIIVKATLESGAYATTRIRVVTPSPKPENLIFESEIYFLRSATEEGGADTTITVNVMPPALMDKYDAEWSVDNDRAVIIKKTKKETGRAMVIIAPRLAGDATLTVKLGNKQASCKIHVGDLIDLSWGKTYETGKPTTLKSTELYLNSQDTIWAYGNVTPDLPENIKAMKYTWSVEGNGIIIVKTGQMETDKKIQYAVINTGFAPAKAKVFLMALDKKIENEIIVRAKYDVVDVKLKDTEKTIFIGEAFTTSLSVLPSSALGDWKPRWTSDNTAVATVDENGLIKGVSPGVAVITVKVQEKTATIKITVNAKVEQVVITDGKVTLMAGDKNTWIAGILPEAAASSFPVTWTSSNRAVATIDPNTGVVAAIAAGTTRIEATAGGKTAAKNLTVVPKENSDILLASADIEAAQYVYGQKTLSVDFDTKNGKNFNITLPLNSVANGSYSFVGGTFTWKHLSAYQTAVQSGTIQISNGSNGKIMHIKAEILRGDGSAMKLDVTVDAFEG